MNWRKPKSDQGRFLRTITLIVFGLLFGAVALAGIVLYQIKHPKPAPEGVKPFHFLLQAEEVSWVGGDGNSVPGWWIAGRREAPAILLSPGYGMSRSDVLSMATALKGSGFHTLIYEQRGCGPLPEGSSTFGLRETDDLLLALDYLLERPGVNRDQIGVWGVDVGAWAALKGSERRAEVRAVVADSAYGRVRDFMVVKAGELVGGESPLVKDLFGYAFDLYLRAVATEEETTISGTGLGDRAVLFIEGENREEMRDLTRLLQTRIAGASEIVALPFARVRIMNTESFQMYDKEVSSFFERSLR